MLFVFFACLLACLLACLVVVAVVVVGGVVVGGVFVVVFVVFLLLLLFLFCLLVVVQIHSWLPRLSIIYRFLNCSLFDVCCCFAFFIVPLPLGCCPW